MKMLYSYLVSLTIIEILIALVYPDITSVNRILAYFNLVSDPTAITTTALFNTLTTTIFGLGVAAIVVGFFVTDSKESRLLGGAATFFCTILLMDMVNIISYMKTYQDSPAYYITLILVGGLAIGFLVAIIDWWRGND